MLHIHINKSPLFTTLFQTQFFTHITNMVNYKHVMSKNWLQYRPVNPYQHRKAFIVHKGYYLANMLLT